VLNQVLVYLPLDPAVAKQKNLPLKCPVRIEDLPKVTQRNELPLEVVLDGLRTQVKLQRDDYYLSYLLFFLYEAFKLRLRTMELAAARELLDEVKALGVLDYRFHLYQGLWLQASDQLGFAESELRTACTMNRNHPLPPFELAQLFFRQGDYDGAMDFYAQSLERDPGFIPALMASGDLFFSLSDFSRAAPFYHKVLQISRDFSPPFARLGVIYNREQRFPEALALFAEGVQRFPDDGELRYNYSFTLSRLSRPMEALRQLQQLTDRDPTGATAWNEKGLLEKNVGLFSQSVDSFRKALTAAPLEEEGIRWNLAQSLALDGQTAEALRILSSLDPKHWPVEGLLSQVQALPLSEGFSVHSFARSLPTFFEDIPPQLLQRITLVAQGIHPYSELDQPGDVQLLPFFSLLLETTASSRLERQKACILFCSSLAGSMEWLAFSICVDDLVEYSKEEMLLEFDTLLQELVSLSRDIHWDFSRALSHFQQEDLLDWEEFAASAQPSTQLVHTLFRLINLLWIGPSPEEVQNLQAKDPELVELWMVMKALASGPNEGGAT